MSVHLYWKPSKPVMKNRLFESIKPILLNYYSYDRFSGGCELELDLNDILFYKGLMAAGVEGASDIINAIENHQKIILFLE
jgi:hypothetical protein